MNIKQILNTAVGGYSLSKILSALVTLLVCLIAVRLIMKVVTRLLSRMQKVNERLQKVIRTSVKVLLYVLTVIITAEALGINTSSLTALLSVLTLGITLAAEDILGNVAGGLVILSANGQMILMPNKDLSSSKIINYTVLGRRRIVRTVTASYDAPTETVMTACMEAVEATANILPDPAPAVHLTDYGASSIEYTIYCWCTVENYWPAYHSINEKLRDTFAKHNVEMTYDHLNVHILDK